VIALADAFLDDIEHALTHHLRSAAETERLPRRDHSEVIISTITDNSATCTCALADVWSRTQLERVDSQFVVPDGVRLGVSARHACQGGVP
jgi:hypothetical protein